MKLFDCSICSILSISIFLLANPVQAQRAEADSLRTVVGQQAKDTSLVINLNKLATLYNQLGSFDTTIIYSEQALELSKQLGYLQGLSPALTNIGISHHNHGNYAKALDFYLQALKMDESLGNELRIAKQLGNIGVVSLKQNDLKKALEYDQKAFSMFEKLKNTKGMSAMCNNMGSIYNQMKNYDVALNYYRKALALDSTSNAHISSMRYGSIGVVYQELGSLDSAEYYYRRALAIAKENGVQPEIGRYLVNLGSIFLEQKKFREAEPLMLSSLGIFETIGFLDGIRESHEQLSQLYEAKGDAVNALKHYKLFTQAKDSLFNQEKSDEIVRHELNYEFDKKEAALKAEQEKKEVIGEAERKKQRLWLWLVASIAIGVAFSAIVIFRSLRLARKQKKIIEAQKSQVEEKQKEILDSIHYAKRIQRALMSSEKYFSNNIGRLKK
jgi:tetratricopeptide (TPR) repeat protein